MNTHKHKPMNSPLSIAAAGLVFLLALTAVFFSQQTVTFTIREGMPAIPLAIPAFQAGGNATDAQQTAASLHEIFSADMRYSRVFAPLPKSYYDYIRPLDPARIQFKDWESIQAKLLVVGEVSHDSEGFVFDCSVYDVKSQRQILPKKRYKGAMSLLREAAHRMSNEMMKLYGEPQIFTTKIAFTSNRDGNDDELYMMDYDGFNQTRLTFNKIKDYMPAWSADGKSLAYTSYRLTKAALFILNPFEGKITEVQNVGTNYAPAFSPDGRWLVFCSTIEEGNADIYLTTADGRRNPRKLTYTKSADTAPSWSPTSREIAFTSDRGGTPQIYIMDAEGSNVRRVSFGGTYHDAPAWSPTGDMIAYVSRVDQIFDIYVLNLRSNQIVKLTESFARNESPCWSPDGRHLIFTSNRTGRIQIFTIDYDGANLRRLTSTGDNKLPNWALN
jgi:TolB protein